MATIEVLKAIKRQCEQARVKYVAASHVISGRFAAKETPTEAESIAEETARKALATAQRALAEALTIRNVPRHPVQVDAYPRIAEQLVDLYQRVHVLRGALASSTDRERIERDLGCALRRIRSIEEARDSAIRSTAR